MGAARSTASGRCSQLFDPDYFRAVGLDPEAPKIIVTRSGYHFQLYYEKIGHAVRSTRLA
ncbi:microcystin LR degradation MlrC domain-containing protein (plasmid) [Rhizobium gallicum]|uniref:Microcystin LR degradation MlrC domain-containing protein n=1 Tax=Rhizobium gallicum TaxID=56730 RepID=A0A1L5NR55_9HYPH|nr:microcystin LR degradation MlrC domain-containing protein [Rhizobium gallicum]